MELGRGLLAGMASGSLMGIFFLGLGSAVVASQPSAAAGLAALIQKRTGLSSVLALMLVLGVLTVWTVVGMLLGIVFVMVSQGNPPSGLGSPNVLFTLGILALAGLCAFLTLVFRRGYLFAAIAVGLSFAGICGWLLPWLAS